MVLSSSIISGRSPPLYCALTLNVMQGHQNKLRLDIEYFWTKSSGLRCSVSILHRRGNVKTLRLQRQNIFMTFERVPVTLGQQYNVAENNTVILYTLSVHQSPCRDTKQKLEQTKTL